MPPLDPRPAVNDMARWLWGEGGEQEKKKIDDLDNWTAYKEINSIDFIQSLGQ